MTWRNLIGAALHSAVQQMLYRRDPRPFLFVKGSACQTNIYVVINVTCFLSLMRYGHHHERITYTDIVSSVAYHDSAYKHVFSCFNLLTTTLTSVVAAST